MSGAGEEGASMLLVDDREENLLVLEATLAPLGQRLVRARSGREALRQLLSQDFAAILLDVMMPEMDGFETAQLIRARERSRLTPLLFLTALDGGQLPQFRAYAVGAVDYLLKPYEPEILRSKVSVFVELHRKTELVRRQAEALRAAQQREHERQLATERARAREEVLEQALRARDDFLSMASHELRTPLTSLKVQVQGALRAAARSEAPVPAAHWRAKLHALERNTGRLALLVDSLLDLGRIGAGRLDFSLADVDLAQVVREGVERYREELQRAGCTLALTLPAHPLVGRWDRGRLDQVVTNLLTNALKYGRGTPLAVTVGRAGERATLEVRDGGIGIAPEHHQRIFERFERAVPHTQYGGFGLGLWIVRQIVQGLGGQVAVDSRPGAGATFRVELPLARADTGPQPPLGQAVGA